MLEDRDYMRGPEYGANRWQTATAVLLILNAVVFLIQMAKPGLVLDFRLSAGGLQRGHVWQLLTYQFLHADIIHLLLNSMGLFTFGFSVEGALGKKRFLALYLLSGVMGGLVHVAGQVVLPAAFGQGGVVGASAGLFGLIAAFALMTPEHDLTVYLLMMFPITVSAKVLAGTFLGVSLLGLIFEITGFGRSSVAHGAHAGGMLGGWLMLRFFAFQSRRKEKAQAKAEVAARAKELEAAQFDNEVDAILDKINKSGIHSLTAAEHKKLDAAKNKLNKR